MQNRDLLHPISESSVILTYFQTKNTLILEDIIPTFHSVACQQGGPDSIFLQSVLIVRWTKWQVFPPQILEFPLPVSLHQCPIYVTDATQTQQLTSSLNNARNNIQPVIQPVIQTVFKTSLSLNLLDT